MSDLVPFLLMNVSDHEDLKLVQRTLKGEKSAFGELIRCYKIRIFNLMYRMTGRREDAEDLTQEAFLRAYAGLHTFRSNMRFSPWMFRIASNLCLNWKRKHRLEDVGISPGESVSMTGLPSLERPRFAQPDYQSETRELDLRLQEEIAKLPPHYRLVFNLRYIEAHSCKQISEIMDIPEGTVKTYLFRAREILKNKLKSVWQEWYE